MGRWSVSETLLSNPILFTTMLEIITFSRAAPFKELQQKQLDFSGKVKGILLEFGLKTCKLPEATKH